MQGSCFLGVMELRSYHSLCSLGVKPYAWELFLGVMELRSYHSLRSLGVKPYVWELRVDFL